MEKRPRKKFEYYTVTLVHKWIEIEQYSNGWDSYKASREYSKIQNKFRFLDKDNAIKHLEAFIKTRPEDEKWEKTYEEVCDKVVEYTFRVADSARNVYKAFVDIELFDCNFNDGSVTINIDEE